MKVVLLKDVEKLGKKYEVKDVKDGYARNLLIPQGAAKPATEQVLRWVETQKEIEAKKSEGELTKIQELASTIDGLEVIMNVKVGEEGQLFESITVTKIAEKLKELGYEIKKSQIVLEKPIKEVCETPVKIKLDHNLEPEIKIIISSEEE